MFGVAGIHSGQPDKSQRVMGHGYWLIGYKNIIDSLNS